jgi:hypothetical protein
MVDFESTPCFIARGYTTPKTEKEHPAKIVLTFAYIYVHVTGWLKPTKNGNLQIWIAKSDVKLMAQRGSRAV